MYDGDKLRANPVLESSPVQSDNFFFVFHYRRLVNCNTEVGYKTPLT